MRFKILVYVREAVDSLDRTIRSAVEQDYLDREILVLDTTGSEQTADIVRRYGPSAAVAHRRVSSSRRPVAAEALGDTGDLIAFLSAGDRFLPGKLSAHAAAFAAHPAVNVTSDSYLRLDADGEPVGWRRARRAQDSSGRADYPESALAVRRGTEPARVAVEADDVCSTALLCSAATHEWHALDAVLTAKAPMQPQDTDRPAQFSTHPPPTTVDLQAQPRLQSKLYARRAAAEFLSGRDVQEGHRLLREAVRLDRSLLDSNAESYFSTMFRLVLESPLPLEPTVRRIIHIGPPEMEWMSAVVDRKLAQSYLLQGVQSTLVGNLKRSRDCIQRAVELGAASSDLLSHLLRTQLVEYEALFSRKTGLAQIGLLAEVLKPIASPRSVRRESGRHYLDRAFREYEARRLDAVPRSIANAAVNSPSCLINRGVLSIWMRSVLGARRTAQVEPMLPTA